MAGVTQWVCSWIERTQGIEIDVDHVCLIPYAGGRYQFTVVVNSRIFIQYDHFVVTANGRVRIVPVVNSGSTGKPWLLDARHDLGRTLSRFTVLAPALETAERITQEMIGEEV